MGQLSLSLLGSVEALLDGEPLGGLRTQKVAALLFYLAAEPDNAHRRERLMTLLWPGMPEQSARSNLRQILYHLRQAVPDFEPDVPLLIANRHTIRLNPDAPVSSDVVEFDALLHQVQSHDHVDLLTCYECYQALTAAVALYRDSFLADFYLADSNEFEEWAETTRQQYRRKVLDALDTLTTITTRRATYAEARVYAERQIAIDDLHESAYRQLMEILALSGQRAAALATYESYRRLSLEELGMAPTVQTTQLYERIQGGELRFDRPHVPGVRGYELKEEIGAGAHGIIYRAIQPAVGRDVAVKIIHSRYANDPIFIRRFEAEAQTIARLEHPHIVPLYDYWREPGGAYLVMRLLRGGNLLAKLEGGPWSLERSRIFLEQISAALYAAHRQGIVHRDIKPANILFDESGNAYLSDFGIAKDLNRDAGLTNAGDAVGTIDYISPEQLQSGAVTPQSDIYSLGAVLYELLTGEKPFAGLPVAAVVNSHLSRALPLVIESRADVPPAVDAVIQQATAKQPSERFPTVLALAEAFHAAVEGAAVPAANVVPAAATVPVPNPYKGLRPYQEADAHDFFGREALVAQLVGRLADSRFLAIVGPSGSGKSSVVNAGLIPALREGALPGSDKWYIVRMVPGTHPLEELELALWPVAVDPPANLLEPMQRDSRGMLRTIRRILPDEQDAQLLLIVDQFEELFTMVDGAARRSQFLESLFVAITVPRSPVRVVVTLRADFYDRPLQYQPLADLFKQHTELVLPLTRDELTWAVQEPARRAGVTFEDGLLPAIVADVDAQPGTLPQLQYALTELFAARRGRQMTRQRYTAIGGVPGALARRADELFFALSSSQQAVTRQLFLRLVTLGEASGDSLTVPDTRRRVRLSEVQQLARADGNDQAQSALTTVLDQFGAARLLTFDRDPTTREPTVEVAHEALLHRWERLRSWIDESRDDIRFQRQLAAAAAEWEANSRDEGYLLRGARLTQLAAWQQQNMLALLPGEQAYLQASLDARTARRTAEAERQQRELETARQLAASEKQRAEEQARAAANLRRRAVWLAGALAVAAILAVAALFFGRRAQENADLAARSAAASGSIALAAGAQAAQADSNTDLALALAMAANEAASPPSLARRVIYDVALAPGTVRQIAGGGGWRWAMDVSADGRLIASAADDGSLTLWERGSGEQVGQLTLDGGDSFLDLAFTEDARYLLTSAYDSDEMILWDTLEDTAVWRSVNPTGDPNVLAIAPNGTLAAAGTEGGVVTLWDMATGEMVGELTGHDPDWQVLPVTFSPDGRFLASGSETGEVIVWDVTARSPLQRLQAFDDVLFALAFSPDGQTLAAAGKSNAVWLFDVGTGELQGTLPGLPDWVFDLTFSADGSHLVVASRDGAVMLWDMADQRLLASYYGEDGFPLNVDFADPSTAVASYTTGNLRVWDLVDNRLQQRHQIAPYTSSFARSLDGRFAAAGADNGVTVVDLETGQTVAQLALPPGDETVLDSGTVTALAFDPGAAQLLSGTGDGRLYLWDLASGSILQQFEGHTAFIHQLLFGPDGRYFLSTADDKQIMLWDIIAGEPRFAYANPTDAITSAAFSPDGTLFAAGMGTTRYVVDFDVTEQDTRILLWETATGDEHRALSGHSGPATALAFSPDGLSLLSGSLDTTLRLWDVDSGEQLRRFDGHTAGITHVAFSPDGSYAVSGAQDGTVIVWDIASGELLRQIRAHEGVVQYVAFTSDDAVWTAAEDGSTALWNTALDANVLKEWIAVNRFVRPLTCLQQLQYGLVEQCDDDV